MLIINIILCLSLCDLNSPKVQGWRGIIPLRSTRADVERLLGRPTAPCKEGCDYTTENEGVFVRYSVEPCTKGSANSWRVPRDTVIEMSIYPAVKPRWSDLKLNRRKFTRTKDPELHGYLIYTNEEKGVTYEVDDQGVVSGIRRFPSIKDDRSLRCAPVTVSISREVLK